MVKLSVIMPVYNGEKYLCEAILSVLKQSFTDFEFIIIDDGSTDESLSIINYFANQDMRIRVFSRENKGLIKSLNEGIALAKGDFIARMDCDDVCFLDRFEKQVGLMTAEHLDVCGGHYQVISSAGNVLRLILNPTSKCSISLWLGFDVPFAHGSVMIRRSVCDSFRYGVGQYSSIEDYDLWFQMLVNDKMFGNVDSVIFSYREHSDSLSRTKVALMSKERKDLVKEYMDCFESKIPDWIDQMLRGRSLSDADYKVLATAAFRYRLGVKKSIKILRDCPNKIILTTLATTLVGWFK